MYRYIDRVNVALFKYHLVSGGRLSQVDPSFEVRRGFGRVNSMEQMRVASALALRIVRSVLGELFQSISCFFVDFHIAR